VCPTKKLIENDTQYSSMQVSIYTIFYSVLTLSA
jgi:hypothetical protein